MIPTEPIPDWLSAKIRRAAAWASWEAFVPFGSALLLIAGIAFALFFGMKPDHILIPLFWIAAFLAAAGVLAAPLYASLRVFFQPERSPEVAYLRTVGSLHSLVNQISEELKTPPQPQCCAEASITRSWLVVSGVSRLAVRRLDDLVWAFLKKETVRLNGALPIWWTHYAVFRSCAGQDAEAKCSQDEWVFLQARLAERCPWILLGHDEEAQRLWDADREAFIEAVQEKKKAGR